MRALFVTHFLIIFDGFSSTFFNVFLKISGIEKHRKSGPRIARKNLDFICFRRFKNVRFHCYLQHVLKVRILISTQSRTGKSNEIHPKKNSRFHRKKHEKKVKNNMFFHKKKVMILNDFRCHFRCQNGAQRAVQKSSKNWKLKVGIREREGYSSGEKRPPWLDYS